MHQITIQVHPALHAHRPEVNYAWRTLLAGAGYAWCEVGPDTPADIVYAPAPPVAPARLWVRADPAGWAGLDQLRLAEVVAYADQPLAGAPLVGRDFARDLCWLLAGVAEDSLPHNAHGHFDLGGTGWPEALRLAPASQIGAAFGLALAELGLPPGLPRWPGGRRAAAAASHDVDYPEVVRWLEPLRVLRRQGVSGLAAAVAVASGRRSHWQFWSWVELERRLGAPSAFYFVPRRGSLLGYALGTPDPFYDLAAPRFRALLRELSAAGWEIGLHASYNAHQQPDGIALERGALERAAGVPVVGNRHHYWRLRPGRPETTLLAHERAGLLYDASLAHDRYLGWRRGSAWPYFPFHRGERRPLRTLQLPTGWMDAHLFLRQQENPGAADELLRGLADTAAAQGGLLLIDIHDYVFDDALFPGWRRAFETLFGYLGQRGDFWLARPRDIAAHWAGRQRAIERDSVGLN